MPNNQSRGSGDLSRFDAMTDEELEQILRLDAQNTQGVQSDMDEILYVMEVLAERNKNCLSAGKSTKEAFESFQKYYMPHADSEDSPEEEPELAVIPKAGQKPRRWLRRLSAVAAAIAVVVVCSVTASAFGFNLWGTIAKWTQETFHFGYANQAEPSEPSVGEESLQDVLIRHEITTPLAPTWFPEGYELVDVQINETPTQIVFFAIYECGEKKIKIQIKSFLDTDPQQVEISNTLVETYESAGITYYVFANYNQLQTAWAHKNYECYISGEVTLDDMRSMIDSIQKE